MMTMRIKRRDSFTLIELLVVMAIIAILAALILGAGTGVMNKAARSRASAEIQAMSTGLESYKTDNGIYPVYYNSAFLTNTPYVSVDPSPAGSQYILSSETLYFALSGQTNATDTAIGVNKSYMSFKPNQLGNANHSGGVPGDGTTTYVKDPFNLSYGYSTGTNNATPYNGYGFFDLWSTGGKQGTAASNTNSWISNWTQ